MAVAISFFCTTLVFLTFQNCSRLRFSTVGTNNLNNASSDLYDSSLPSCSSIAVKGIITDQSCNCLAEDIAEASSRVVVGRFLYNMQESDFCAAAKHVGIIRENHASTINLKVGIPCRYFYGDSRNGVTSKDLITNSPVATFYFRNNDNVCSEAPIPSIDVTCSGGTMTWTSNEGANCSGVIGTHTGSDNYISTAILDNDFSNNSAVGSAYFICQRNDATGTTGSWLPVTDIPAYSAYCSLTPSVPTCNQAFSGQTFADASQLYGTNLCNGGITVNNQVNITANGWTWTCQGQGANANLLESCSAFRLVSVGTTGTNSTAGTASTNGTNGTNGTACNALAGSYCVVGSDVPVVCTGNSSCAGGNSQPQTCGANSNANSDHTACITINGSGTCAAPAGSYCTLGTTISTTCPAGSYCTGGTAAPIACSVPSSCPAGTASASAANTEATISISGPNYSISTFNMIGQSGLATYTVTYGANTNPASIQLSTGYLSFTGGQVPNCGTLSITPTSALVRTITFGNCSNSGTFYFSILAGSATSTTGQSAAAAGPSSAFTVDLNGPVSSAVTIVARPAIYYPNTNDNNNQDSLWYSPAISFSAASSPSGRAVNLYQLKIINKGTNAESIMNYSSAQSGLKISLGGGDNLGFGRQFSVTVRAADVLGNWGAESTPQFWTNITECEASVPLSVCSDGMERLGHINNTRFMTTPGGCPEIPTNLVTQGQVVGQTYDDSPSGDFNVTCSGGTDTVQKSWNNGKNYISATGVNTYLDTDVANLTFSSILTGGLTAIWGSVASDSNSGALDTTTLSALTNLVAGFGGYYAAASYCDKLDTGGYKDWFLPSRKEIILLMERAYNAGTNTSDRKGLVNGVYWTSSEESRTNAWQAYISGYSNISDMKEYVNEKRNSNYVRCMRKW